MIYTFGMMALFIVTFGAGVHVRGPAAFLTLGVLATLAGLLTAAVQTHVAAHTLVLDKVKGVGRTLTLGQFREAAELRPREDVADHVRMPLYIAIPEIKPITEAYTCQLGGRRVLILEHDPKTALPETVEELF